MVNAIRGEAEVNLGDRGKFKIVATMEALAAISHDSGCGTLQELMMKLVGVELHTTIVALRNLTVYAKIGNEELTDAEAGDAIVESFMLSDSAIVRDAFSAALSVFIQTKRGRKPAAKNSESAKRP